MPAAARQASFEKAKELIKSSLQTVTARALLCAWAFIAIACSIAPSTRWMVGSDAPGGLNSFMGVHFGDSPDDVERRYPNGSPQTSPYGAPAYLVENVTSGTVDYRDVIYEFAERAGMQMVIAHFAPSSTADVYKQLQDTLGAPSSAGATTTDPSSVESSWHLPDGASVLFSGPSHRLVLIGKDGGSLKPDIHLRDVDVPVAS